MNATSIPPASEAVVEALPPQRRQSSNYELFFEDLDKLDESVVVAIQEFLVEKVDHLQAQWRPDLPEELVSGEGCSQLS